MFWILTSLDSDQPDRLYPDYDGFRILNDSGSTATLLTNHSKQMRGLPYEQKNSVYLTYPVEGMKVSAATFTVRSYPMPITGNKVEQVQLRLPESDQLLEMTDNDGDGYYEVEIKADDIGYGNKTLITIASFTQGERQTDRAKIEVDRPIIGYEVGTRYDFNDGTLQGWQKEGTWQANWKNPALQIATDLGSPMLQLNLEWSGKHDWEELKLRNYGVESFGQHTKMRYTLYVPVTAGDQGGVRPYAALGDGWVKLDADKHRSPINQLEKVQLNGKTFYKQIVEINLGDVSKKLPDIFLCIVGDKLALDGSVFIDDIEFLKPIYN